MERHRGDRDRDRDRDRSRERYGGGDNNPDLHQQQRRPSRFSDAPPEDHRRSPGNFRHSGFSAAVGGGVPRRAFESPPRPPPSGTDGGFRPVGSGFFPMGGGGGFINDIPVLPQPVSGQKRGFPFSGRGASPEHYDGRSFVKLFVGSVPRTATEEEIRPVFQEHGNVLEVALIKDKRTGQQQGCCFIKYATSEEADRAIRALHNQCTLSGGVGPIQVRYADGERERLGNGAVEYKLFVGSLNKFATEKEVEEIFAPYGRIEDVYLMRDERRQSRGCGFVKFSNKDSAMAAINGLNGTYTMEGCDQPLTVRFADPKRPRGGEPRSGPAFGGPGFGPLPPPGIRPVAGSNFSGSMGGRGPPNAWQPMSHQNLGPASNAGVHGFGSQFPPRSGGAAVSSTLVGHLGPQGSLAEVSVPGAVSASSTSPQNFNQSFPLAPASGQQISPLLKPLQSPVHFPTSMQLQQGPGSYSHAQTSQESTRPLNQMQVGVRAPYNQASASQQPPDLAGQFTPAQFQVQQSALSATAQQPGSTVNSQPNSTSSLTNPQQPALAPQQPLPFQQSPSQLAQMLSQQTQTLQASFQSSQQAFSQLQQQFQMIQPSTQNQLLQQNYQGPNLQSQWAGVVPTTAVSASAIAPLSDAPSTSSAPVGSVVTAKHAAVKSNWSEHTSPDGYKYYYNSVTHESRWLKPEELTLFEQQQQMLAVQQPQSQPSLQAIPPQQATQSQQSHLQKQLPPTQKLQHPPLSSMYQAPGGAGGQIVQDPTYTQLQQTPVNSVNDPTRFQQLQGFQVSQEWAWKNNSGGT